MSSSESDKITLFHNDSENLQSTSIEKIEDDLKQDLKEDLNYDGNQDDLNDHKTDLKSLSIDQTNDDSNGQLTLNSETKASAEIPEINVTQSSLTEKDIENMFGSPYHKLQNNVFVEGNMVSYVAPNFNELLRKERGIYTKFYTKLNLFVIHEILKIIQTIIQKIYQLKIKIILKTKH